MVFSGNVQRGLTVWIACFLLSACGGGGGGGGGDAPASVTEQQPSSTVTVKAALNRSNALFLAGSALAVSSASTNLYDIFTLTQHSEPMAMPARMSARSSSEQTASYQCANGAQVMLEQSSAEQGAKTIAHFSNCQLNEKLTVSGSLSLTRTDSSARLEAQDFRVEKSGQVYLYDVNSQQSWVRGATTTLVTGIESVTIENLTKSWSVSSGNTRFEQTLDNATAATLAQSITARIESSEINSVQLINNRIFGENNTSIKIGSSYLFWDLLAEEEANIELELDDNGDYTADFFNSVAMSRLLSTTGKSANHAPTLSTKPLQFHEKVAGHLGVNASDADHDFLSYQWTLVSASHNQYFFDQTHSSHPAFGATEAGEFEFLVQVSDGNASSELTVKVEVQPIDFTALDALATPLNPLDLAYGEDLLAQLPLPGSIAGAQLQVLNGPDGFSVSPQGVMSWSNDHLYDGGQFRYCVGILRNGYWEKIWFGAVYPAAQ